MEVGSFFVVATPIGNLGDMTFRAVETLKSVDYIACEDTRVTRKLLDRYSISAKLFDYQKFNEKQCSEKIVSLLEGGSSVALVSDAGTPGISDPGRILFEKLREKNIKVTPIPGSCAVVTFLSAVERDDEQFLFYGFLPRVSSQQSEIFNKYRNICFLFYESPKRLVSTLETLEIARGKDVKIAVGRELTKTFEEIKIGSVSEIIEYYKASGVKGEIVVMVYPEDKLDEDEEKIKDKIRALKKGGYSDKDISKILSLLFDIKKNKVYELVVSLNR